MALLRLIDIGHLFVQRIRFPIQCFNRTMKLLMELLMTSLQSPLRTAQCCGLPVRRVFEVRQNSTVRMLRNF